MKINKSITIISLYLFIILQGNAQLSLHDTISTDPKVKIGKLSNGFTYYIRQNKKPEQKVELRLVVNAGSILEDDDQQGLAHMCEHMAFNGTKTYKKNEIVSFLQSIGVEFGADLNAGTSFDETIYILPIPTDKPDNLEKGIQIIEDWAHQVTYLNEDIEGERNIILEESRMGKGAQDRMLRKVLPKLLASSKYAQRLPIGVDSIIKNFNPDAIRRFYHDWYRPDLMAVMVVGDIDPAKAEEMIKKHFSEIPKVASPRERLYEKLFPYTKDDGIVVADKEAISNMVNILYSAFPQSPTITVKDYKNDLLQNIFIGLLNDRYRELTQKENPPFVQAAGDFSSIAKGYNQFSISAIIGNGDVRKAVSSMVEEVEKIKRFGFTQIELDRAKKNLLTGIEEAYKEKDKTSSSVYVEEYIRNFTNKEPVPGIATELKYYKELLPSITLNDVNAIIKIIQDNSHFVISLSGPETVKGGGLPTEEELIAAVTDISSRKDLKPNDEKAVENNLITKLPMPGKVIKESKNALMGTVDWKLSNGITVSLKKTSFKNDEILMGATRPGGKNNYGIEDKFSVEFLDAVISSMGVGNFSPVDLSKALTGKVASVSPSLSEMTDDFSGSCNTKDVETMFQLLYLYVTQPKVDTSLFKSFKQKGKAQTAFMLAEPQISFVDTLIKSVYGNHPLAPIAIPRPEYYDNINLGRVMEIYKERFGNMSGMHFVFVGNVDEQKIKLLVERYIASLPTNSKNFAFKDNGVRPIKGAVNINVNKGQAQKSLILTMYNGEVPYNEGIGMKVNAISEILNIKVVENLREKIQGIYSGSVKGEYSRYPYSHYSFFAMLPCGPQKIDTLISALNNEIESLKMKGPSIEDLNKVKKQWIEQNKVAKKENSTWLAGLVAMKFPGINVDRFLHYEKYVNALTPKDIQEAAKLLLNGKNVVTAILRPEKISKN